jgi:hypothetical protein
MSAPNRPVSTWAPRALDVRCGPLVAQDPQLVDLHSHPPRGVLGVVMRDAQKDTEAWTRQPADHLVVDAHGGGGHSLDDGTHVV